MAGSTTNKVILVGNLGHAPEIRYTASQKPVANFNIATNEGYFDKSNKWVEQTEWHKCVVWLENLVEKARGLQAGDKVYVDGKLTTRKWTDQNNQTRYTTEIVVSTLYGILLPSGSGDGTKEAKEVEVEEPVGADVLPPESDEPEDDSVPF